MEKQYNSVKIVYLADNIAYIYDSVNNSYIIVVKLSVSQFKLSPSKW